MDFSNRLVNFREQSGLTQQQLADLLGIRKVTIIRWENKTSKPSHLAAIKLEEIGFGKVGLEETNHKSIPRIILYGSNHVKLKESIRNKLRIVDKHLDITPASYVINGPEDQINFFETLYTLQEKNDAINERDYLRRLSAISLIPNTGIKISQYELEKPKANAKHWNPNYGTHGWHRYVGRFPSHLIRALLNHFTDKPEGVVLDPFVGSGTTLVEGRLLGFKAIGVEICPLSALISRTKSKFPSSTTALEILIESLSNFYIERWNHFLKKRNINQITHEEIMKRPGNTIPEFVNYEKWFTPEALLGTSIVVEFAGSLTGYEQDFICCALSSCMRSIGNVDVNVIRAEYSKVPRLNVDVLKQVKRALTKMIGDINESYQTHKDLISNPEDITVIRDNILNASIPPNSIDYIITSPPYGTESLSYIRTHLLSYRSLQPILNYDPYAFNEGIIGSEFIKNAKSGKYEWETSKYSKTFINFFNNRIRPDDPKNLVKRNYMMMQFFDDMVKVAEKFQTWLKIDGRIAFVVGNKKIGDDVIPTDVIIAEIFKAFGLKLDQVISHKLKFNNSNSEVPWQEKIIQNEFIMLFTKEG